MKDLNYLKVIASIGRAMYTLMLDDSLSVFKKVQKDVHTCICELNYTNREKILLWNKLREFLVVLYGLKENSNDNVNSNNNEKT